VGESIESSRPGSTRFTSMSITMPSIPLLPPA
jgi:hypothetical protein